MRKILLFTIAATAAITMIYSRAMASGDTTKNNAKAKLFLPGEIGATAPYSACPAFSPGFNILFVGQNQANGDCRIMTSTLHDGKWSALVTSSFSGRYRDLEPAYAPDGKYLIFASNRPLNPADSVLDGHYSGTVRKGGGGNLWKVTFSGKDAGLPERLPEKINSLDAVFSPAVTGNGSLYFMRADSGGKFHIYRSALKNGIYESPVKASFSMGQFGDYDPAVAPDESFLIFSSPRPPAPKTADLFIVFRTKNGWSEPVDLRTLLGDQVHGVEARLSPDLTKLYYSNSQKPSGEMAPAEQYIWEVDLTPVLKAHGIKK